MNNDGKYAEVINEIAEHIYQDNIEKTERRAKIKFSDGNIRELDLLVTLKTSEKIVFEVRDRKGNQGVEWVDQVIGKYKNMNFSKIWICTFGKCSLSKDAIRALEYNNIGWKNINICNEKDMSNESVLYINAIKLCVDDKCDLIINGEKYKELIIGCLYKNGKKANISLREQIVNEIKNNIINEYDKYTEINKIDFKTIMDIGDVENNFESSKLNIKISIPVIHYDLFDYFSENYIVSDDYQQKYLLSTKNKSVFITNDYIALNFSFLANLRNEGYIISNHYMLNIKAIPEKYRNKNKIKIIDVNGNSQDKLIKVIGYKNNNNFTF